MSHFECLRPRALAPAHWLSATTYPSCNLPATILRQMTEHHLDRATQRTMNIHDSITIIIFFAAVFGIFYLFFTTRHRERMNMIDKGMSLQPARPLDHPLRSLKSGLLLIGVGIGFLVGFLFQEAAAPGGEYGPLPYAVGMCIFGGLALVFFYVFFGRKQQG